MDYAIDTAPARTTTAALLEGAGADLDACRAVWYAFPQARFVKKEEFYEELEVDAPALRAFGEGDCMADALRVIVDELRGANECTCTFGHEGAFQLAAILGDGCQKKGQQGDVALLDELARAMAQHATCPEGRAAASAVLQALELFGDEIGIHFEKRQCPTCGCVAYRTFHVLVSKCTGCGACLDACEDGAIMGKPKFVHVVDQAKCTQCARCLDVCPEGAVVRAGAKKPKTPPRPIPVRR